MDVEVRRSWRVGGVGGERFDGLLARGVSMSRARLIRISRRSASESVFSSSEISGGSMVFGGASRLSCDDRRGLLTIEGSVGDRRDGWAKIRTMRKRVYNFHHLSFFASMALKQLHECSYSTLFFAGSHCWDWQ